MALVKPFYSAFFHDVFVEFHRGDHTREEAQTALCGIDRIEDHFLVFLHVFVISEGNPLHRGQDGCQRAVHAAGFPRTSSAMSGFFFCGIMLLPVLYASSSSTN